MEKEGIWGSYQNIPKAKAIFYLLKEEYMYEDYIGILVRIPFPQ